MTLAKEQSIESILSILLMDISLFAFAQNDGLSLHELIMISRHHHHSSPLLLILQIYQFIKPNWFCLSQVSSLRPLRSREGEHFPPHASGSPRDPTLHLQPLSVWSGETQPSDHPHGTRPQHNSQAVYRYGQLANHSFWINVLSYLNRNVSRFFLFFWCGS